MDPGPGSGSGIQDPGVQTGSGSQPVKIPVSRSRSKTLLSTNHLKGVFTLFDVWHMLNPPLSNVPPKRIFLDHPFGLQFPKRGAPNPSEVFRTFFLPFFPSHRRTLWDRNFPWNMLNPPLKGFFFDHPFGLQVPTRVFFGANSISRFLMAVAL